MPEIASEFIRSMKPPHPSGRMSVCAMLATSGILKRRSAHPAQRSEGNLEKQSKEPVPVPKGWSGKEAPGPVCLQRRSIA